MWTFFRVGPNWKYHLIFYTFFAKGLNTKHLHSVLEWNWIKGPKWTWVTPLIINKQFGIIQNLQTSPIPQTRSHCLDRDLNDKRPGASSDNIFIFKKEKNRSYGRFWIYQLISIANPALIPSNKAGLAVLISW